jgi:hypothetical protein
VRTLNRVAMTHPMAVTNSNIEMEALIPDVNRSIATLAISTLLKTGAHSCNGCVLWAWGGRKFGRGQVPTFQVVLADRGHWRKAVSCTCMRTVLRAERFEKTTSRDKGNAGVQPSFGFASCDRLQPHHGSLHTTQWCVMTRGLEYTAHGCFVPTPIFDCCLYHRHALVLPLVVCRRQ